jgi:ABC-type maltose transport system permease subunit
MSESFDFSGDAGWSDEKLKRPPKILTYLGLLSVLIGALIGVYGVMNLSGSTTSTQIILGGFGYFFTAFLPIVLLQIVRSKHAAAFRENKDVPYDIYAGIQQRSRSLKIVAAGLLLAALPIYVLFLPLAEKFVS